MFLLPTAGFRSLSFKPFIYIASLIALTGSGKAMGKCSLLYFSGSITNNSDSKPLLPSAGASKTSERLFNAW